MQLLGIPFWLIHPLWAVNIRLLAIVFFTLTGATLHISVNAQSGQQIIELELTEGLSAAKLTHCEADLPGPNAIA